MENSDASACTSKLFEKSCSVNTGSSVTAVLRLSNAFWHSSVQIVDLFFFNNSVSEEALPEDPLMNL